MGLIGFRVIERSQTKGVKPIVRRRKLRSEVKAEVHKTIPTCMTLISVFIMAVVKGCTGG